MLQNTSLPQALSSAPTNAKSYTAANGTGSRSDARNAKLMRIEQERKDRFGRFGRR